MRGGWPAWLLGLLLCPLRARGEALPQVTIVATVDDSLRAINGTVTVEGNTSFDLPLMRLPVPTDDVLVRRTFPGRIQHSEASLSPGEGNTSAFRVSIGDRYGAAGHVPRRGLFLNGLWHPQPIRDGAPQVVQWDVTLYLPPDSVGVLNGQVGETELHWQGEAERLALAVVPGGRQTTIGGEHNQLVLVERGPARPRRAARLAEAVEGASQATDPHNLVVVDTPSRRRLVRTAPQTLFLSDRAFRVTGGLWRFHLSGVQYGILNASLPITDPWLREIAASAYADDIRPELDLQAMLGWAAWIPEIDALLYDGRLPYYSDVFEEVWPGDPVADDLHELYRPTTSGRAVCARLNLIYGDGACRRLADALVAGQELPAAIETAGLVDAPIAVWRDQPQPQHLELSVVSGMATVTRSPATRVASGRPPTDNPLHAEPIVVRIDDTDVVWNAPAGPGVFQIPLPEGTEDLALDPDGITLQDTRSDDRWPARITPIAAFFPSEIALTNRRISAAASLYFRRQYSTRWLVGGDIGTDPINLIDTSVGAIYSFGPLLDRRSRPFDVWFGGGPAVLDPRFRPVEGTGVALGVYAGAAWDTTVDPIFPRHGHRLRVYGTLGALPGESSWTSLGASAGAVQGFGGRFAIAGQARADIATGDILHRLLPLGGGSALQAIPPQAVVGEHRYLAKSELRWQAVRFASVPGPAVWLSDVQLSAGAESGWLTADGLSCPSGTDCAWSGIGWTAGVLLTGDVFGVRPTTLGATASAPLFVSDPILQTTAFPQIYVRLGQTF